MAKVKGSETYVEAARWACRSWPGMASPTESVMSFRYRESIVATISGRHEPDPAQRHRTRLGLKSY